MNGDALLAIFPSGSLSASIITTVYVGICVAAFFNLRFGWSASGLVVPGYLVPLFMIKPVSAGVVMAEGVLAYLVVLFIFEYGARLGGWNSVFGRDRFFALLLSSVIVRLTLDGWLLPVIGEMINSRWNLRFDYQNQLYSFGLIVVALIANQFWKPGLIRGVIPFGVTLTLTWAIIRFGLMEWTNFSISNLGYMYEDIATSMLAAPKAYIILLTTAFIASHMNLHYGWEYSGILIPSLIALLWYQPMKIAASFVETFVVLAAVALALRLPALKRTTIEGARKILLFFTVSYIYKFLLAHLMLAFFPEKKITDYYGFGYLLPSLLAIKMFDKEMAANITRATIQTSFTAIVLASAAGFGLTLLSPFWITSTPPDRASARPVLLHSDASLPEMIQADKVRLYQGGLDPSGRLPHPGEIEGFSQGIRQLLAYAGSGSPDALQRAGSYLSAVGYTLSLVEDRYLYLRESASPSADAVENRGIFVIDIETDNRLGVEMPAPIAEKGALAAGEALFRMMAARTLAAAGGAFGDQGPDGPESVDPRTFFHAFHRVAAPSNALQVRGYTPGRLRAWFGWRSGPSDLDPAAPETALWVKRTLPPGLRLKVLERVLGDFPIRWQAPPGANIQRAAAPSGFAELYLKRADILKLFYTPSFAAYDTPVEIRDQRIEGYLHEQVLSGKQRIAEKGSGKYRTPKLSELLFFDQEILTPMFRLAASEYRDGIWTAQGAAELRAVSGAAATLGYDLIRYRHKPSGRDYLLLMEKTAPKDSRKDGDNNRYWGTYVLRLGESNGYAVQVPRPIFEINAFEFGLSLFERLEGVALLISGAHKDTNLDGSADVIRMQNQQNLFNLFHQVLLRERSERPIMVLQSRALGVSQDRPNPGADLLVAFRNGIRNVDRLPPLGEDLLSVFRADRLHVRFVDGAPETAGYEVGGTTQSRYLDQTAGNAFAILWITPEIRASFRQQTDNRLQDLTFDAAEIPTTRGYIHDYLLNEALWETGRRVPGTLYERIIDYVEKQDLVVLKTIVDRRPEWRFRRFIDLDTRQGFLLIHTDSTPDGRLLMVANLSPLNFTRTHRIGAGPDKEATIARFIENRSPWLIHGAAP